MTWRRLAGLIEVLPAVQAIADRAYDADRQHNVIVDQGGEPVIPSRRHSKHRHGYDKIATRTARESILSQF
ncbi:hypothetical protein I6F07_25420 [Ensifer sp. IC4062]|nr:hypothetical protein [Ensifer sp. IC4062]